MDRNEPIGHHDVEKLNEALARKDIAYLFIGKGAAVLHGFPDTTRDVDIFPRKDTKNTRALLEALTELGFTIDSATAGEIVRGKDFVQLRNGRFPVSRAAVQPGPVPSRIRTPEEDADVTASASDPLAAMQALEAAGSAVRGDTQAFIASTSPGARRASRPSSVFVPVPVPHAAARPYHQRRTGTMLA